MRSKKSGLSGWLLLSGFCVTAGIVLALCAAYTASIPDIVGRSLTAQETEEVVSRNSPLVDYIYLSPNASFPRESKIQKITIHHMGANLPLEEVGEIFSNQDRRSSSNYAIDSNGRVALYVEESSRAWSSGSTENDDMAVTIEVANDEEGGNWHVSDEAYETLIELCTDICRRNGIEELVFTGDETGNLTMHKMFSETECPGPYLESKMEEIAEMVNQRLGKT